MAFDNNRHISIMKKGKEKVKDDERHVHEFCLSYHCTNEMAWAVQYSA